MDKFPNAAYPDEPDPDNRVPYWRQYLVEGATVRGEDDDSTLRVDADGFDIGPGTLDAPGQWYIDRRDREHVCYYQVADGSWKPTHLKRGDHVIAGGLPLIVIGPATNRATFHGYYAPWFGDMTVPVEVYYVYERAPDDVAEDPMPVIPPPPEELPAEPIQEPTP